MDKDIFMSAGLSKLLYIKQYVDKSHDCGSVNENIYLQKYIDD